MTATQLAAEFSRQLSAQLTTLEMASVVARNAIDTNPNVCHSHDFCDANQVMLDAMTALGATGEYSGDAAQVDLINEAWVIARAADFHADWIASVEA